MIDDCYFFKDLIGKISGIPLESLCNFEDDHFEKDQSKTIDDQYNKEILEAR